MSIEPQKFLVGNIRGLPGIDGVDGFAPIIDVVENTVEDGEGRYVLDITTKSGTIRTPNIAGPRGLQGNSGRHGLGVLIMGEFDTLDELEETHPIGAAGQVYFVDSKAYIWDTVRSAWVPTIIFRGNTDQIDPFVMWVDSNENLFIGSFGNMPDLYYDENAGGLSVFLGPWTDQPFRYDQKTGSLFYSDKRGISGVISGSIIMWSGSILDIPYGWVLCDGRNDTPDLRNRFVVGAGNAYQVGNVGGQASVVLTEAQMPSHTHTGSRSGSVTAPTGTGVTATATTTANTGATGGGQAHENRPPYYALAYIMKT